MKLWNVIVGVLVGIKDFLLGLNAEQITLISVGVTLIIFMAGQRSETKIKKLEVRRAEYKKFIELLQKSLSGGIKPDENGKQEFFDTGVSLLLYGSKRVYKKYIFFREYSTNPIVQNSKYNDKQVLLYVIADILKVIRHEVGLTSLSELESNDALSFFVNDIGTNPLSRIESYKSRYNILMIKSEIFFYNRYKLLTTKKVYYHIIKPFFGVILMGLRYLLIPIGKFVSYVKDACFQQEKRTSEKVTQEKNKVVNNEGGHFGQRKKQGFFKRVFELEWKVQRWVARNIWTKSEFVGKVDICCFVAFIINGTLMTGGIIPVKISYGILVFLGVGMLICTFLKDSQKAMTTLGGFLQLGMCLIVVVGIVILLLIATVFKDIWTGAIGQYLIYIIISFALSLIWGVYSSFCNAGVATLANALLTGVIGLVILTKDLLVNTLFVELSMLISDYEIIAQMEAIGYSAPQFIDGAVSLLFYPPLLMTGFATMVCAAKKYWIDKYNGQKDIDALV